MKKKNNYDVSLQVNLLHLETKHSHLHGIYGICACACVCVFSKRQLSNPKDHYVGEDIMMMIRVWFFAFQGRCFVFPQDDRLLILYSTLPEQGKPFSSQKHEIYHEAENIVI